MPEELPSPGLPAPLGLARPKRSSLSGWIHGLLAVFFLYLFIAAINTMGHGLKTIARSPVGDAWLHHAFSYVKAPLAGLCFGVLVTSIVQSSSFTTSFVVGLVSAGDISLASSIPIVMGANVGTSVTNILVSLAHLRRRREFRRSLAGAIVHDFFNVLCVIVFLPLEVFFGVLSAPAYVIANSLGKLRFFSTDPDRYNFIKTATAPLGDAIEWLLGGVLKFSVIPTGAMMACLAVALLFIALFLLVRMLHGLMKDRLSGLFDRTLFRSAAISFVVGLIVTVAVQSSSITTSLVVPLVGAGVLRLRQIYPYTLGANIGTTVTAILAALGTANPAAMGCAMAHLLFNIYGTCVFWPLKWIPLSLAKGYAKVATRRRFLAGVYILVVFFLLPILILVLANW